MLELFASDVRHDVQDALVVGLVVSALIWGSGPERATAATWLFAFEFIGILDDLVTGPGSHLAEVDLFVAFKDWTAGGLWLAIALYANRNYTLWIAGLQIIAMTTHLVRGMVESILPIAYATLIVVPGWLQLMILGGGISRHVLRKRKYGRYRDWRNVKLVSPGSPLGHCQRRLIAILGHDFFEKRESGERTD